MEIVPFFLWLVLVVSSSVILLCVVLLLLRLLDKLERVGVIRTRFVFGIISLLIIFVIDLVGKLVFKFV